MVLRPVLVALLLSVPALSVMPYPARAETAPAGATQSVTVADLSRLMMIPQVMDVMRAEGIQHSADLSADLLAGQSADAWQAIINVIYNTDRMTALFDAGLAQALGDDAQTMAAAQSFFGTELGQRMLTLEIDARMALLDATAESAAKVAWDKMAAEAGPRAAQIIEFAGVNDLIESNVMGALNANLAFYRGLSGAGAFGEAMAEEQMLGEVWAQEPAIRTETTDWLYPFLAMSYQPLADGDLQAYIDFSASPAGKKLNAAVFVAFDAVMVEISGQLGAAAGRLMAGQDI